MAERRMFSKTIIDSDAFLDMPLTTQCLYFHLSMRADDDGFVNNAKKIRRMIGASDDDLRLLLSKRFLLPFESGVVVIKHWKIHNYIRSDRYKPTVHKAERALLTVKENGAYTELHAAGIPADTTSDTIGIPDDNQSGYQMETQVRLGNVRLDKVNGSTAQEAPPAPSSMEPKRKKYGEFGWVKLTDEDHRRLLNDLGESEVERCIRYVDEAAQSTGNKNKWRDWNLTIRRCSRDGWGLQSGKPTMQRVRTSVDYENDPEF